MRTILNSHSIIKRLHGISGIFLSIFIFFHLLNHLISLSGPEAHIAWMQLFRKVYRNPVIETMLLTAVVFQVITGIRLLYKRHAILPAEKIQIYSGLYLAMFLIVHVTAVMVGRYIIHLDTNFYFAATGLNYYPANILFLPYYFFAVVAISLHISAIHYLKTHSTTVSYAIAVAGIAISTAIILGFTDFFQWIVLPAEYENFIKGLLDEI